MITKEELQSKIENVAVFKASRSSGPGGQHVNKTSSKITAFVSTEDLLLSEVDNEKLLTRFGPQIVVWSQSSRSQLQNRKDAVAKITEQVFAALQPKKVRYDTKPSKQVLDKIKQEKQKTAEKKAQRRWRFE